MKLKDCIIAYSRSASKIHPETAGRILIGPYPDKRGWSDEFDLTTGGCFAHVQKFNDDQAKTFALSTFVSAVIRDGLDPHVVHDALLAVDEYRQAIATDVRGSND